MIPPSPFRQKLITVLVKTALLSYHHFSEHYHRLRIEMARLSDAELFEETKRHPSFHLRVLIASLELLHRGYCLGDIRESRDNRYPPTH